MTVAQNLRSAAGQPAAKKMAEKTEWEKTYDRIKANAQKVDIIAEREAFEAWQKQCGLLPIDTRHHDEKTGYRDTITGRNLDRWDAWLARAVENTDGE